MERNSGNGTVLKGADEQADDTGLLTEEQGQSGELTPLYEKVEQVLINARPTDVLLADLSPETTDALFQQAHAATAAQLIDARSNISLAFQNAPEALAKTGNYAGVMPGPEAFATVYGAYDGGQQFARFDQKVKVGKQVFDMRAMSNQEIQAQLLDAAVSAGHSQEGQSRYQTTAAAAQQVLEARSKDPAGQAGGAFPEVNAAWLAVFDQGGYNPAAVQKALALTVAAQQHLGIKNLQPVPQSVLESLRGLSEQDIKAKTDGLLAGTTDPDVKLAMSRQFAGAGLLERPAQAPMAAPLEQSDFDNRFGLPSKAPLEGKDASRLTQAPAQLDETLSTNNSPVAADSGSQALRGTLDAMRPAKKGLAGTVRGGNGWTEITGPDGKITRRVGARNWRNNNPGNIEYGKFARSAGAVGSDGRFAVFPDYETGRAAKSRLLFEGKKYRGATISSAMEIYAPRTENDTDAYIKTITSALGMDKDTPLSSLSKQQQSTMMDTMQRVEGFRTGTEYIDGKAMPAAVDDNSNPPVDPTQALPEQMNPPPGRPDVPSSDLGAAKSDNLSEGWVGHSTRNISVLPSDIQESAKPYLGLLGKKFRER